MYNKKQKGFALLEVMVSALVLAVAVIAFVKLTNLSLKRAQENNNLSQATASANALIEVLRSNPRVTPWFMTNDNGNFLIDVANIDSYTTNCRLGDVGSNGRVKLNDLTTLCAANSNELRNDLRNQFLRTFAQNFQRINGKAILCLRTDGATERPIQVRTIVVWKYSRNGNFSDAALTDCPATYNDAIPDPSGTLNTTTPDRGYYEIYTLI